MAKQHDKQFKLDAVQYYLDHKELGVRGCAQNLGIGYSTLTKWLKIFRESGDISVRGSGNYAAATSPIEYMIEGNGSEVNYTPEYTLTIKSV